MNKFFQCILNKFTTAGFKKTTNLNKLRGFRKNSRALGKNLSKYFGFKTQNDSEQIHPRLPKSVEKSLV